MFGRRRNIYRQVSQLEAQNISYMVKFWLQKIEHEIFTDKCKSKSKGKSKGKSKIQPQPQPQPQKDTSSQLKNVTFDLAAVVSDFLTLYDLNRKVMSKLDNSSIRIREKTIVLSTTENFGWIVNVVDEKGLVTQYQANPTLLGMSVLNMFAIGPFKHTLEPDILMAICYYCDQTQ